MLSTLRHENVLVFFVKIFPVVQLKTTLSKKEFSLDLCKWLLPRLAADLGNTDVLRVVSLSCVSLAIHPSVSSASFPLYGIPPGYRCGLPAHLPPFVTPVQTRSPDRKGLLSSHTQSGPLTGLTCHLWVDTQLRGAGQFSRES